MINNVSVSGHGMLGIYTSTLVNVQNLVRNQANLTQIESESRILSATRCKVYGLVSLV